MRGGHRFRGMLDIAERRLSLRVHVGATISHLIPKRWQLSSSGVDEPVANLIVVSKT